MSERQLYPEIEPYESAHLDVGDLHQLYVEVSGNPTGKPVIFLHGGPGGRTNPDHRRFFDPEVYRIVLFDQRGSGRSTPAASIEANTTWHLVEDIEKIRKHLDIDRWQVFGGSWGSTLALAYSQTYLERVTELVLRGIFMLRKLEIAWFYQSGAHHIYPDAWEDYLAPIPDHERDDLVAAYHKLLTGEDANMALQAARAWATWEHRTSNLIPNIAPQSDQDLLAFARIENHYFVNGGFFSSDRMLLDGIERIRHIPAVIIQGRYDIVCPMVTAWELHCAWPEAEFIVVPDAGHAAMEPGNRTALLNATDRFRTFQTVADG